MWTKEMVSSSSDQIHRNPERWEQTLLPHDTEKGCVIFNVIAFNRRPRRPSARPLLSRTWHRTFRWHPATISPFEKAQNLTTEKCLQNLQAGYWLAWLPLWFEMVVCIHWWLTIECDQHKIIRHTSFGAIEEINTPEQEGRPWQNSSDGRPSRFARESRELFWILSGALYWHRHRIHQLCGKTVALVRWFDSIGGQCNDDDDDNNGDIADVPRNNGHREGRFHKELMSLKSRSSEKYVEYDDQIRS